MQYSIFIDQKYYTYMGLMLALTLFFQHRPTKSDNSNPSWTAKSSLPFCEYQNWTCFNLTSKILRWEKEPWNHPLGRQFLLRSWTLNMGAYIHGSVGPIAIYVVLCGLPGWTKPRCISLTSIWPRSHYVVIGICWLEYTYASLLASSCTTMIFAMYVLMCCNPACGSLLNCPISGFGGFGGLDRIRDYGD